MDGGPAFDSAAAPSGGADLPMRRYAHDLARARGELLFEGRTGVAREVTGFAPKPKVARDAALDMFGQIEADWGRILPDGAWIRRCLGNLMSLAPGPSGERRLGQRALWTGWDDHFEAQLALEPTGAGPLRVVARDVSPASGTRGGRATFSGEVRLAGGRLAELRLEAEVDTKDPSGQFLARRVVQTLTLEPPTR